MTMQRKFVLAGLAITLLASAPVFAAVNFTVDPAATWYGYMNVFELPVGSGAYLWGSPWATADLPATFTGDVLRLTPNTNVYNASDPYWVNPDGTGAKWMNANMYREDTNLVGETVNFAGLTVINTLVSGYTCQAFIKVLDPAQGWLTVQQTYAPLVTGQPFSLSLTVGNTPGLVTQFGFVTDGADANPATVAALGAALVRAPEPASLLAGLIAALFIRRR